MLPVYLNKHRKLFMIYCIEVFLNYDCILTFTSKSWPTPVSVFLVRTCLENGITRSD